MDAAFDFPLEGSETSDYKEAFKLRSRWKRWYLRLLAILKRVSLESVVREALLRGLRERLAEEAPGLLDPSNTRVGEQFFHEFRRVDKTIAIIRQRVASLAAERRSAFLRHLAKESVPEFHERAVKAQEVEFEFATILDHPLAEARKKVAGRLHVLFQEQGASLSRRLTPEWRALGAIEGLLDYAVTQSLLQLRKGQDWAEDSLTDLLPNLLTIQQYAGELTSVVNTEALRRIDRYQGCTGPTDSLITHFSRLVDALERMRLPELICLASGDPLAPLPEPPEAQDFIGETLKAYVQEADHRAQAKAMRMMELRVAEVADRYLDRRRSAPVLPQLAQLLPLRSVSFALHLIQSERFTRERWGVESRLSAAEFSDFRTSTRIRRELDRIATARKTLEGLLLGGEDGPSELEEGLATINRSVANPASRGHRKRVFLHSLRRQLEPALTNIGVAMVEIAALLKENKGVTQGAPEKSRWRSGGCGDQLFIADLSTATAEVGGLGAWHELGVALVNFLRVEAGR